MNTYINIHSHKQAGENEWCLQNLHQEFGNLQPRSYYSAGIHPRFINEKNVDQEIEKLKLASNHKNVIAIGECGLDRLCDVDFQLQTRIFIAQIIWANETAKPLIIHCVRAHQETLSLLKEYNRISPVIFHGFNNNADIAKMILQKGYYISFGHSLLKPETSAVFSSVPLDFIFLETDDKGPDIIETYHRAAGIRNISIDDLTNQMKKNLLTVFKNNIYHE